MKPIEMNAAERLLEHLGVYGRMVKSTDKDVLAAEKAHAKRRTRPMTGRGNYGLNLMAYFDMKRRKAKAAKKGE